MLVRMSMPGRAWQTPPGAGAEPGSGTAAADGAGAGDTSTPGATSIPGATAQDAGTGAAAAPSRRGMVRETWFVQVAFLLPGVVSAVDMLAAHLAGAGPVSFFPTVIRGHPVENLILSGASYLAVGSLVPLVLLLLTRTGNGPASLGLAGGWRADLLPGLGIAGIACASALAASLVLSPVLASSRPLVTELTLGPVPAYYLLYGLLVAAVTAITEEILVNGYLLTRLSQLGWQPQRALLLSLALRTSYHLYYGLGLVLTIPFGYYATRSFQKRGRLGRPVIAHFCYDAALITVGMAAAAHR